MDLRKLPRRDRCYLIGSRAGRLPRPLASIAWYNLARQLDDMQDMDVPKFNDLLEAIRSATLYSKSDLFP